MSRHILDSDLVLKNTAGGIARIDPTTKLVAPAIPGEHYARADATVGVVNVLDKGADPTGATASDAAFIAAMTAAFASADYQRNRAIYVPSGTYLLTEPNILNQWTGPTTFRSGVTFYGDGWSSRIIFRPATADAWLYNGQLVPGRRFMFLTVRDIRIDWDASVSNSTVNGFCQNGLLGSPDQGYAFVNCKLLGPGHSYPSTLLKTGPADAFNTDCNRFVNVRGSMWGTAMRLETSQSIIHYSIASDWENISGPLFDVVRGGQLVMTGGSVILGLYGASTRYGSSLLRVVPPVGASAQTTFRFESVKTEVWDPDCCLYDLRGKNNVVTVTAEDCDHVVAGFDAAVQDWFLLARMEVSAPASLTLRNCDLHGGHARRVEFINENLHNWQYAFYSGASATIDHCKVNLSQPDDVLWTGADAEGGLFRMRGCEPMGYSPIQAVDPAVVLDVDRTGPAGTMSRNGNALQRKTWCGFVPYWPIDLEGYRDMAKIQLPAGSTLVSIRVRKEAVGVDPNTYQLKVTNGDGSTTYGTSTEGRRDARHDVFVNDIYKRVTTATDRVVRITCVDGKFGDAAYQVQGVGDFFIVEYL